MEIISAKHILEEVNQAPNKDIVEIGESEKTPKIFFDKYKGIIKFSGRAMPENAKIFFEPLIEWIEKYIEAPQEKTSLQFDLEYFNSSTSKLILQILNTFKELPSKGKALTIEWYYMEDDDDMLDSGKTFEELTQLDFEFICYE